MNNETTVKTLRLPKELIKKIEESAKKEERTFTSQVIYIIKKYYELQEKN